MNQKHVWEEANLEERRKLLLTILDAIYIDARKTKPIIAVKPKLPFIPIFRIATTKSGSDIRIVTSLSELSMEAR